MSDGPVTRCNNCKSSLKLKSAEAIGKTLRCPRCGHEFVARQVRRRRARRSESDTNPLRNDGESASSSDASLQLPGRGRSRPQTPIEKARQKRKALLKKQEEAERAQKPKKAAMEIVALLFWINAHVAVVLTVVDCLIEIVALAGDGSVRQIRGPLVILALTGGIWFYTVLPRDINDRAVAAFFGLLLVTICGLIGYVVVAATNSALGYEFFQVRWGPVYLGLSLILFSIWGYGSETLVEYAERMMANGDFGSAVEAIERELEKNPDNLRALQIRKELRDMLSLA